LKLTSPNHAEESDPKRKFVAVTVPCLTWNWIWENAPRDAWREEALRYRMHSSEGGFEDEVAKSRCGSAADGLLALVAMLAIYFFSFFQRSAIPPCTIFNELQQNGTYPRQQVTALGSIFLWIYGGMQIFLGIAVDRFAARAHCWSDGLLMSVGPHSSPCRTRLRCLLPAGP